MHQIDDVVALLGGLVVAVAVATVVDRSARRATAARPLAGGDAMLASLARSVLAGDRRAAQPARADPRGVRPAVGDDDRAHRRRRRERSGPAAGTGTRGRRGRDRRDHRHPRAAAARTGPARERAAGAAWPSPSRPPSHSSRAGWQRRPPRPSGWRPATACAPPCSPPSATTCAPRWPGSRPPCRRCARTTSTSMTPTGPSSTVTIDESADRLTDLVDNLLDMSRLQAGRGQPRAEPRRRAGRRVPGSERAGRSRARPRRTGLAGRPAARPGRSRTARAGGRQPGEQRGAPCAQRPGDRDRRRRSATGSSCGSSTAGPVSPSPTGSGCSPPSSGSVTPPPVRASGSGWRWPAG